MSSERGWRGGEQQVAYLLEDLSSWNIHSVLAVKERSRLEQFCQQRNITSYTAAYAHSFDIRSAMLVKKICRMERIDIIHLHSSKAQGIGVLSALLGNRVPMVLSRRVAFLPGKSFLTKWKYNHPQIRKILCVSQKITEIMKHYVRDGSRCLTVYSGIDLHKFRGMQRDREFLQREFNIDPARTVIATIGALDNSKDHATFIETVSRAVKAGHPVQGLIVGDGPLAAQLKEAVQQKGLDSHVTFTGYRNDVGRILVSVDMFLMTSREEGLGTSLLDAFLARVPVVATAAGGIPEIVRHMDTGLLAEVADATALSEHVIRLINDVPLRDKLVLQAYHFVMGFSKEKTSQHTLNVYENVLQNES